MKKRFKAPLVFLTTAEINSDVGGRTGQGWVDSMKPIPMSFGEWTQSGFCGDLDGDSSIGFGDYTQWWNSNGFGEENLLAYNPELAVTEEVPEVIPDVTDELIGDVIGEGFGG